MGGVGVVLADDDGAADNETPRHAHPDEVGDDSDLEAVEGWLARFLGGSLRDGAIELSEGEYELARGYIGDDYDDRLGQYVSVLGDTDGESAENEFTDAQRTMEELTDAVEEFERLLEEYEAAIEAGDEERARELARELNELADEIDGLSEGLLAEFEKLEELAGIEFAEAKESIAEVNEETQADRSSVTEASLVETNLTVTIENTRVSFPDPVSATGQVKDANGTPVANETVRLELGPDTVTATTDETGTFTAGLRPTLAPLTTSEVTATLVPSSGSPYLGSTDSTPVTIEQVEPTITIEVTPTSVALAETMTVRGTLEVDGIAVDNVSLELSAAARSLDALRVDEGSYAHTVSIPVNVPDGDQMVTVAFTETDRALAPANTSTGVTIEETTTALSVDADVEGDELAVRGVLETTDGKPIEGQQVSLRLDGTSVGDVETTDDGSFEATVAIPGEADDEMTVVAVFDGTGTNLAAAESSVTVAVPISELTPWRYAIAGIVLIGFLGVWILIRRGILPSPVGRGGAETITEASGGSIQAVESAVDLEEPDPRNLERARAALEHDPNAAVALGYAAIRRQLRAGREDDVLTHWEFYRARAGGSQMIRSVTELYERAMFSPSGVSRAEAGEAVRAAESVGA